MSSIPGTSQAAAESKQSQRMEPRPGRRLRVAALMDTGAISGPGRQLVALATALRRDGVDMRVFTFQPEARPRTPFREFLAEQGVDQYAIRFSRRVDFAMLTKLRREFDAWAPDIVQTHSYRPTTLAWLLRRQPVQWRWIGFFHGWTNEDLKVRLYHWLDRRLLPSADRIVVMSRPQAAQFRRLGPKVVRISNAVLSAPPSPTSDMDPLIAGRVGGLRRPRVGAIGRLSAEKGVDVLLRALAMIDDTARPELVIAGDGPERARLEAMAVELGVAPSTHFLGSVTPIEPLYPLLDAVVIPSRSEGLPNVLLEAFRADVPVVATRVGAIPDVVGASRAALLVPPNAPAALADAIVQALSARGDVEARQARSQAVAEHSLERRVAAHLELYREVLSIPSGAT